MPRAALLLCALVSAGLLSGPADARLRDHRKHSRQEQRQEQQQDDDNGGPLRPDGLRPGGEHRRGDPGAAARRAQQRNGGGRVLSVEPEGDGYRVKVLKDGEVRVHHVEGD